MPPKDQGAWRQAGDVRVFYRTLRVRHKALDGHRRAPGPQRVPWPQLNGASKGRMGEAAGENFRVKSINQNRKKRMGVGPTPWMGASAVQAERSLVGTGGWRPLSLPGTLVSSESRERFAGQLARNRSRIGLRRLAGGGAGQ